MNKVLVVSLDKRFRKNERRIKNAALKTLKILNKTGVSVEIYLADSRKMKFLNKKFRGKNKTTTILSFKEPRNFIFPKSKFRPIGEIYLNVSSIKYPALSTKLVVHGILHLLGYNHEKKNDRIKMEKKENWMIRELDN